MLQYQWTAYMLQDDTRSLQYQVNIKFLTSNFHGVLTNWGWGGEARAILLKSSAGREDTQSVFSGISDFVYSLS